MVVLMAVQTGYQLVEMSVQLVCWMVDDLEHLKVVL